MRKSRRRFGKFFGALSVAVLAANCVLAVTASPASAVLPTSACTITGPLTPRYPADYWGQQAGADAPFVQFQVSAGGATYAGVFQSTYNDSRNMFHTHVQLFYYSAGHVTFLDTLSEDNVIYQEPDGSMEAVGFDAQGDVVARIQHGNPGTYLGWRYDLHGHKWMLQSSPLWTSVEPIGVAGDGTIIGNVSYRGGGSQIVSWTGEAQGVVHLLTPIGYQASSVDQRGDVFYSGGPTGSFGYVRQPNGTTNMLTFYLNGRYYQASEAPDRASVASGYGIADATSNGLNQVAGRWDVPAGVSGQIVAHRIGYMVYVDSVGLSNDVVGEYPSNLLPNTGTRVFITHTGKAYRMPPQFLTNGNEPHTVINRYGQVVYTATDGLPHMIYCPA